MAVLLTLKSISDNRGSLVAIDNLEKALPFSVKRIFYIQHAINSVRGGHRHFHTQQALICLTGNCTITVHNDSQQTDYLLNSSEKCLVLENTDWHTMHHFSANAILLGLASTVFDPSDYIYEPAGTAIERNPSL